MESIVLHSDVARLVLGEFRFVSLGISLEIPCLAVQQEINACSFQATWSTRI